MGESSEPYKRKVVWGFELVAEYWEIQPKKGNPDEMSIENDDGTIVGVIRREGGVWRSEPYLYGVIGAYGCRQLDAYINEHGAPWEED